MRHCSGHDVKAMLSSLCKAVLCRQVVSGLTALSRLQAVHQEPL